MAGKGGGAWKVAYADFVTAMMAFFMVMWITAQNKPVKVAIAHYFNAPSKRGAKSVGDGGGAPQADSQSAQPFRLGMSKNSASGMGSDMGDAGPRISPKPDDKPGIARKPSLRAVHDGQRQMVGTLVTFEETSAELNDIARQQLKNLVPSIAGKRNKIEIRGHATRRPLPPGNPYPDLMAICYARCSAVKQFLEREKIAPERIRLSQAGADEPYTLRVDPKLRSQNARVEVYVLSEYVDDLVGTRAERAERVRDPTPASAPPPATGPPAKHAEEPHTVEASLTDDAPHGAEAAGKKTH
jgi:chemotaxis protein MotB